ncbi:hypothetical protein 9L [Ranavirus ambystoma1]|uniref:Uncharacterized protein n=1 Tax=Ranavirus ambystoma1 TaxID=265294 RepID=A0A482A597_9VIRU|nr:hypothetical protein 9L [Ambystoma tigrinum virus]QBL14717.1 hypothetical protein 9L [Ambystoma tigrinum virus]QBL14825.1 hypothetical protein 9L [Ambystoma tigrinum virus]QBL14933.1 hypothetical protein 9L [Ambystoma tigrinum virus]QBL15041.1 hypothetical protein 9L [Ambystoma tigrinum virus]
MYEYVRVVCACSMCVSVCRLADGNSVCVF